MADDKHADDKKAAKNTEENLTPTPTQAEMDEIMAKMTGAEVVKKPEAKEGVDPTSTPPVMSQEENDLAMAFAAPGEDMPEPKKKAKEEAEAKRRKEMEAEQSAGYKTRTVSPTERK